MSDFWYGVSVTTVIYFCVWIIFRTYDKEWKKAKENEDFLVAAEGGVYTLNELREQKGYYKHTDDYTPRPMPGTETYNTDPYNIAKVKFKEMIDDPVKRDEWFDNFDPDRNRMAMPTYCYKHSFELLGTYIDDVVYRRIIYRFVCRHCPERKDITKLNFWKGSD